MPLGFHLRLTDKWQPEDMGAVPNKVTIFKANG